MTGDLDLPPLFRAVVLREHRDAFAHAREVAGVDGAGTLVWVRRFDSVEFAVVLEPEEPLSGARRAIYAAMNAAGDALAAHCPPEKPIVFTWPDTILLDGAVVGGARLGWPEGTDDTAVPAWMVAGVVLRSAIPLAAHGTGASPFDVRGTRGTSLELEGFEMMDGAELISSFARHLMLAIDLWQTGGFKAVAEPYLARLPEDTSVRRGIDGNGDLLIRNLRDSGKVVRQDLTAALAKPQWLDPETGDPWL
jgi:Biotin/lipoate A/B protein ligase family